MYSSSCGWVYFYHWTIPPHLPVPCTVLAAHDVRTCWFGHATPPYPHLPPAYLPQRVIYWFHAVVMPRRAQRLPHALRLLPRLVRLPAPLAGQTYRITPRFRSLSTIFPALVRYYYRCCFAGSPARSSTVLCLPAAVCAAGLTVKRTCCEEAFETTSAYIPFFTLYSCSTGSLSLLW